jgi:hypothetical protein
MVLLGMAAVAIVFCIAYYVFAKVNRTAGVLVGEGAIPLAALAGVIALGDILRSNGGMRL